MPRRTLRFLLSGLLLFTSLLAATKTRIAVMGLEAKAGIDANVAATISDLLGSELVSLKRFEVVDRKNMDAILKEQALQNSGCTDSACAVKLGNVLNVQRMVVGSVAKLGSKILITVNFVDVERSQVAMSERVSANDEDDILGKVTALAQRIGSQIQVEGKVLSVNPDGSVKVNIGSDDGIRTGLLVDVRRYGKAILDQATGEMLGREVADLGQARVVSVDAGGSLSTLRAEKGAQAYQENDKVFVASSSAPVRNNNMARNDPPPPPRNDPPVNGGKGGSALVPVGAIIGGVGVVSTVLSFVYGNSVQNGPNGSYALYTNYTPGASTPAYTAVKDMGTFQALAQLYKDYQTDIAIANVMRFGGIGLFGLGTTFFIAGLVVNSKNQGNAMILPILDPRAPGIAYVGRF